MANTLGNLFSSLRTRASSFFDDEDDKVKLQTKPIQTTKIGTRTTQRRQPQRLKFSGGQNSFSSNFKKGFNIFKSQLGKDKIELSQEFGEIECL